MPLASGRDIHALRCLHCSHLTFCAVLHLSIQVLLDARLLTHVPATSGTPNPAWLNRLWSVYSRHLHPPLPLRPQQTEFSTSYILSRFYLAPRAAPTGSLLSQGLSFSAALRVHFFRTPVSTPVPPPPRLRPRPLACSPRLAEGLHGPFIYTACIRNLHSILPAWNSPVCGADLAAHGWRHLRQL
ncbi:hypothetical protein HYPSUDRAFT_203816 [Hypholoma sublateritium FD-334 SS-4]|uniref:Uncharacterized protein n=1 Tax=Hypholoma sublateritium (strain FD-334 SS-4) TaxID=945553 RepID=A0A0D2PK12_HYPSF|nr:hypothetical protein HYPSUDRAFT_203816 [Hypholoma sublateritium FD-334 SS-4]